MTATQKGTKNMKQARWKCPICNDGLLAPTRPRLDDVRRYCLPCSSKSGRLVERIAPALEAQRTRRSDARREQAKNARKRERARIERKHNSPREVARRKYTEQGQYGMNIKRETARLWKMLNKIPQTLEGATRTKSVVSRNKPPIVKLMKRGWRIDDSDGLWVSSRAAGIAYGSSISIAPNVSWETLAHEIIHCAGYHGHDRAFYYALKWLTETRWKMILDFSDVTRYGYIVDATIESQIADRVRAEFEKSE